MSFGLSRQSLLLTGALLVVAAPLAGQDSTAIARDTALVKDTSVLGKDTVAPVQDTGRQIRTQATAESLYAQPPVSPMGALWRSILLPGWGQAKLNRKLTGAIFVMWEGVTLGMSIKTTHELAYLRETGSASVHAKAQEQQDWLVLLGFNHLFAGIEAYVSAHLWDFPSDLQINAAPLPGGGFGANLSLPFRLP